MFKLIEAQVKIQYKSVTLRQKLTVTYQKKLLFFLNIKFAYFIVNRQQYTFKIKVNQQVHLKLEKKTSRYDYEK